MRRILFISMVTLVGMLTFVGTASANNYVSFDGKFFITYPDNWRQIEYNVVDAYLLRFGASQSSLQYEAVFAPGVSDPFFKGSYLILNVDTVGALDQQAIDIRTNSLDSGRDLDTERPDDGHHRLPAARAGRGTDVERGMSGADLCPQR